MRLGEQGWLAGIAAAAGLVGCGGADRAAWAERADAVCARAGARIVALGRPASLDEVGPAARRTAGQLGAAGAEVRRLERPEKDPDITRVTRGFGAAQRGLVGFADAVARGDDRAATLALHGLERERRRWSDAADAVGMRRCTTAERLTAGLDALRKPLYAHALGEQLADLNEPLERAYELAELRGAQAQDIALDDAWSALDQLRSRLSELEPPHALAVQSRAWAARLDALNHAIFDLMDAMRRAGNQAGVNGRYRALRRAIRAEHRARRSVLRGLDLGGSVPALPQETSQS